MKVSKVNKLRDKISGYYDHSHQGHHEDELKFIGKRNIYFHQNFIPQDCQAVKYKEYEPKYVYGHDYGKSFPPVLAMFRPYENNMRKRMIQSMKTTVIFMEHTLMVRKMTMVPIPINFTREVMDCIMLKHK